MHNTLLHFGGPVAVLTRGGFVPPDVNSAQVVIKRERVWRGSFLPWTVWLDGQKVGALSIGGSLTLPASPGQHDLVVSPPGFSSGNFASGSSAGAYRILLQRRSTRSCTAIWAAHRSPFAWAN